MTTRIINVIIVITSIIGAWQLGIASKFYAKAWLAEQLIENAWQATLKGQSNVRPWPWADTWPVAEILVPRLDTRQIVLSGDSGRVLAFGPGLSVNNMLEDASNIKVISGHRDSHFRFLKNIKAGDKIIIKDEKAVKTYTVDELAIVDQRNFQIDTQVVKAQRDSLILVTCYPFDALIAGGDMRLLVLATKVDMTS